MTQVKLIVRLIIILCCRESFITCGPKCISLKTSLT